MNKSIIYLGASIVLAIGFGILSLPTTVRAEALSLTFDQIDTPDPVAAGANLIYTLNFTIANGDATNLVMTSEIPTNTSFVSASSPGAYDATTNKVSWNFGTLTADNYVATLTVKVYSPLANGTKITSQATLDADIVDPITASEETTVSSAPILELTKSADTNDLAAGGSVLFTILVKNTGTDTAVNVKLADTMPTGFMFENSTNSFAQSLGNIEAGKQVATSYTVKVDSAVTAGNYTNTATVTSDNYRQLSASQTILIRAPQVLGEEVTKEEVVTQEETLPEPTVLGAEEESLPQTGVPLFITLLASLLGATGLVLVGRKIL